MHVFARRGMCVFKKRKIPAMATACIRRCPVGWTLRGGYCFPRLPNAAGEGRGGRAKSFGPTTPGKSVAQLRSPASAVSRPPGSGSMRREVLARHQASAAVVDMSFAC